jgi:hypothetical protein
VRTAIYYTFTGHGIVLKGVVWYYCSGDANRLTIGNTAKGKGGNAVSYMHSTRVLGLAR